MDIDTIMEIALATMAAARALLLVLDRLDDHIPQLKPATNFLGSILGGKKERFREGE